ncbi:hypothetical protein RS9916_31882 [Synechococcus sp. RS9916]|nr:hypothetical protein RS9916_31882 [Synechococcus sp. RS9916]
MESPGSDSSKSAQHPLMGRITALDPAHSAD